MAAAKKRTAGDVLDVIMSLTGKGRVPTQNDLGRALLNQFGGPEAMAKLIFKEFEDSEAGSMQRVKILDFAIGCLRKGDSPVDFADLDTEDLRHVLEAQLEELDEHAGSGDATDPADRTHPPPATPPPRPSQY